MDISGYCLALQNGDEVKRFYYFGSKSKIDVLKENIDIRSLGTHEVIFEQYSGTRVYYNPLWDDSLEFRSSSREAANCCAEEMGFKGLFASFKGGDGS